jgi:hypothetical protein
LPPDERFWQRYSPHHEFPLSSVISLGLHLVIVALLLLAAWVAFYFVNQANKPLPVEAVQVIPDGGGGGNPQGVGNRPGVGETAPLPEDTGNQQTEPSNPKPNVKLDPLEVGAADPLKVPEIKDKTDLPGVSEDAIKSLKSVSENARKALFSGLAGKGQGGPGEGGGKGTGVGSGTGSGIGEGKLSERQKRVLRWAMVFHTESGGPDYLRQLVNLRPGGGAILAIPQPPDGTTFRVIRDLHRRPVQANVEDIRNIHRIYWVDDQPSSVDGLARALGIAPPPFFVAFFPVELEQHLAKLEHDYRGLNEDQIEETKFTVVPADGGTYQARVLSQVPKH